MKPKVLFCIPGYKYGGIESNTEYICRFASEVGFSEFGLLVEKQNPEVDFSLYQNNGWEIYQIDRIMRYYPVRYCRAVYRIIKDNRYTIIHSFNEMRTPIYFIAARLAGIKVKMFHPRTTRMDGNKVFQSIGRVFVWLSTFLASINCTCSTNVGNYMFGKKPFTVINNAIDTDKYLYSAEEGARVRKELHIAPHKVIIGNVGRFCEAKNHSFLLRVFAAAIKQGLDAELLLVGNGPLLEQTKALAKELDIVECVHFLGSRTDVARLYQAMDVLLFPSIYEGYPNVIVEAQASGLQCLMSDCITSDVILTDLVKTLPLTADIDVWAAKLIAMTKPHQRYNRREQVIASGHDARTETKRLLSLYDQWNKEAYGETDWGVS